MPAGWLHELIEKATIGYSNKAMQKLMDSRWTTKGVKHREFGHDVESVLVLALLAGGDVKMNVVQGLLHILIDQVGTEFKSKMMKMGIDGKTADTLLYYYLKPLVYDEKGKKRKPKK